MQYRTLGRTGLRVSALGLGANQIGRPEISERETEAILRGAVDRGINFIDTAAMYKLSEERIGRYLEDRRDRVVIATKCGDYSVRNGDTFRTVKDYTPEGILRTIDASRKKLRTDLIDIVQFHGLPKEAGERTAAIEALLAARDRGWVRFVGVSIDELPPTEGLWPADTQEFNYNVLEQEAEETLLPEMIRRETGVIIRRPIANAVYLMDERPNGTYFAGSWDRAQHMDVRALADDLAPVPFALRFVLSHPGVHTAIVGCVAASELEANARAWEAGPLPEETLVRTRQVFRETMLDKPDHGSPA